MFGNAGLADGAAMALMMLVAWSIPVVLAVWLIRTLSAMAAAQRDIANHLRDIEQHLRDQGRSPIA